METEETPLLGTPPAPVTCNSTDWLITRPARTPTPERVFKIRAGVRAESALRRFDGGVVVGGVDGGVVVGGVAIMIEIDPPVA
jgi:hypothetical protein